ncbi:hypothetical protein EK21DRAFT_70684 [Setomelanomma holmii]|uniref:Uncharacterized protein n=1 Tax=Setomelanomma holmii TaxID=210430 RepID=A0A9P4H4H2_9PLEO|nr:hypothetical protein EK21DRAFT_70684 [Setomelanomma holmii]
MPGGSSTTQAIGPQLSQRTRTLQQGSLTAKMVFGRLTGYTRKFAEEKQLPPFIHPSCYPGEQNQCPPGARHRCLPGTLAVCANLAQMFYSRLPGSHGFVWQQICAHLRQLQSEYATYDMINMLQGMQAAVVYGILCSQCTESVSVEDAAWLVETIEDFGERLYDVCIWGLDARHVCLSRVEWVFLESLRRIYCVLFLIDLLLRTDGPTPASEECPEFYGMPLPCSRDLWQTESDLDWQKRYQEHIGKRAVRGGQGPTFRDLLAAGWPSRQKDRLIRPDNVQSGNELANWCENADDLSMLLWMALTIERDTEPHNN